MGIINRIKYLFTGNKDIDIKSVFDRTAVSGYIREPKLSTINSVMKINEKRAELEASIINEIKTGEAVGILNDLFKEGDVLLADIYVKVAINLLGYYIIKYDGTIDEMTDDMEEEIYLDDDRTYEYCKKLYRPNVGVEDFNIVKTIIVLLTIHWNNLRSN